MSTPWIAPFSPDVVWFEGSDAIRFLNDLISQEIADMESGEARRSLLLGPDGKLLYVLWVLRSGDRIGLVSEEGRGEELAATLGRYKIRVDVEVVQEPEDRWLVIGDWSGFDVSWDGAPRWLVVGERPDLPTGSADDYETLRISAGEPSWGSELSESTIPHESSLVPVAVDFTKGCFLGQELVARMDSRAGSSPRQVRWISSDGEVDEGATLTVDGKDVGLVTSASGTLGLGVVHRSVAPGAEVDMNGQTATVLEIPRNPKT